MNERYWQNWDAGDTAERIDAFWLGSPYEQESRRMLAADLARVFAPAGERTLYEVGCGTGLMTAALFEAGWSKDSYRGGDVSEAMLAIARERHPEVTFEHADVLNLPERGADEVACIHVLQHLPHYRDALAQLVRFTRRRLYVATWLVDAPEDRLAFSPVGANPGDQSFHDNRYALPPFVEALRGLTGREPAVQRLTDLTCSVVVDL